MANNVRKDISDLIVHTDVMADLLGYTRQRVNQLVKEGILERKSPGRFYLKQNVKKYIEYMRLGYKSDDEEEFQAQYWEEKALHEKVKREMAELQLAKNRNQMHDAVDVEQEMTNMLTVFRNRILGIPSKLAPKVIGMENLAEISEAINTELLEALTELSEYDPEMFASGEEYEEDEEAVQEDSEGGGSASETNN